MSEGNGHRKVKWTPTEKKILTLLSDGRLHSREELHSLLPDEVGALDTGEPYRNLNQHLFRIRQKLSSDEAILCDRVNGPRYRYVKLNLNPIDVVNRDDR